MPVLALYGSQDGMRSDWAAIEAALPDSRLVILPSAAHACYKDAPAAFNAELLRFLDGVALGARHGARESSGSGGGVGGR